MLSPDQLQQIIQAVVATMTTANTVGDRGDRREGDRNILHEKMFRRMEAFTGGDTEWKEWLFNFGIAMTSAKVHVAKVMRHIELEAKSDVTVEMVERQPHKKDGATSGRSEWSQISSACCAC